MGIASHFIDGKAIESSGGATHEVIDPSNGEAIQQVTLATADDVDAAVAAAKRAFPEWSSATPGARSDALAAFARLLGERASDLADVESRQAGKPIRLTTEFDVPGTVDNAAFFSGAARNLEGRQLASTAQTTPRSFVARRSVSLGRSLHGTIRCRWRRGRSSRPSPLETRSC